MTRTRGLLLLTCAGGLAAAAVLLVLRSGPSEAQSPAAEAAQTVSDLTVAQEPWHTRLKAYGQVRAVQGADLSSQVSGIVEEIGFQSGDTVRAGTVLLRLRPYDDPAKLAQLQAEVGLYAATLARDQKQFGAQAISRATLDLDTANLRSFQAQVSAQMQAIDEKIVRAPFDGRLGLRQVDLGQYIGAGTPVVNLQALDPVYVDFNVAQQQLSSIVPGQLVSISVDAWPGRIFQGRVTAIDNRVEVQSRMASVRASLDNKTHALLPGMFAVASLDMGGARQVLSVPQAAISFNPYGNFVFVVHQQAGSGALTVTSRVVELGEKRGDRVVVVAGLRPGERVVTAGQLKLHDEAAVRIDNSVQPEDSLSPDPVDE